MSSWIKNLRLDRKYFPKKVICKTKGCLGLKAREIKDWRESGLRSDYCLKCKTEMKQKRDREFGKKMNKAHKQLTAISHSIGMSKMEYMRKEIGSTETKLYLLVKEFTKIAKEKNMTFPAYCNLLHKKHFEE